MTASRFDYLPDRRPTESIKWHTYAPEVLPMWVADMDFLSPEPVIQALRERVEHGVFGYPEGIAGNHKENATLRALLVDRLAERYGWQVQPEALVFIPGVVTGFNLACHALAQPEGQVVIQTPVYTPILQAAATAGMHSSISQLTRCPDGSYEIDWLDFESAFNENTRLFLLCNPHNPVGRVFRQDELEHMAQICLRHHVTIVSDEIHGDLIFSGHRHLPIASLNPEIARHTITLMAPSKTYNLAGLECSFAIIPDEDLRQTYNQARQGLVGGVNLMGLVAAQAAYQYGQPWLDELLVYLEANRDYLYDFVKHSLPGIRMSSPEGTYLAWLNCQETAIIGNPYKFFLENARVAFNDGPTFGPGGEGYIRLNFGCPRSMLVKALDRMATALQSL